LRGSFHHTPKDTSVGRLGQYLWRA
jgi:hypothetical protein